MKVLVTGGAGYVGSTICSALADSGLTPVILDSLVTGRDEFITDKIFYKGDIGDTDLIETIFREHGDITHVIHCAEKAAVDLSVLNPYEYYCDNVVKSLDMFKKVNDMGCKNIVFCSTAGIYDDVAGYMVTENSPINPRSPFTRTKYIMEMTLKDFCRAYGMRCISLRNFNPIGADINMRSGLQAKNPVGIITRLLHVASGDERVFSISGRDWGTRDGTCLRDYVHVWDVALAHVAAVTRFDEAFECTEVRDVGFLPINIGSGIGVTVREFITAFENVTGRKINVVYTQRRLGDIAGSYANTSRAKNALGWEAKISLEEGILDAIRWEEIRGEKLD